MISIRIRCIETHPSGATFAHSIRDVFEYSLERFIDSIRGMDLSLTDTNGPRGGVDKACCVRLQLAPRGIVVAKGKGTSLLEAARDACDRLKSQLTKKLGKRRSRRRLNKSAKKIFPTGLV